MTYEIHDITLGEEPEIVARGETLEECLESLLVYINEELLEENRLLDVVRTQ